MKTEALAEKSGHTHTYINLGAYIHQSCHFSLSLGRWANNVTIYCDFSHESCFFFNLTRYLNLHLNCISSVFRICLHYEFLSDSIHLRLFTSHIICMLKRLYQLLIIWHRFNTMTENYIQEMPTVIPSLVSYGQGYVKKG